MKKHTLTFTREKDTKNTVRFQEEAVENQAPVIGALYVQKWAVGDAAKIKVTVEEEGKK